MICTSSGAVKPRRRFSLCVNSVPAWLGSWWLWGPWWCALATWSHKSRWHVTVVTRVVTNSIRPCRVGNSPPSPNVMVPSVSRIAFEANSSSITPRRSSYPTKKSKFKNSPTNFLKAQYHVSSLSSWRVIPTSELAHQAIESLCRGTNLNWLYNVECSYQPRKRDTFRAIVSYTTPTLRRSRSLETRRSTPKSILRIK